jgi:PEP-CTERM motif
VEGAVALNGADLVLDLLSAPTRGESFDILTNDGTDPIIGQFSEGSQVTGMFDGKAYSFRIDYAFNADGGSVGNDIRLTAVPEPATWLLMGLGGLIVLGVRPLRGSMA